MQLRGWVSNSPQGVSIEVEGGQGSLDSFIARIHSEKPQLSSIHSCETTLLDPKGYEGFEIRESASGGSTTALVLPDIATCPDCLRELFDVRDRRYLYPFTNCTHCGPRFTIIRSLPYDRNNTTMSPFIMCEQCEWEYRDPSDRRFHAQPNACPQCGPHVELWDQRGTVLASHRDAILDAAQAVVNGGIVAVKGLGGYLLLCDARRDRVVQKLRDRKHREEKPFALMFPSIDHVERECRISELERRLLLSPQAPIVLVKARRHQSSVISRDVAPGNPCLGVMLPSTPLHHVLLSLLHFPVVATSGNISDEPICASEDAALKKLDGIADRFLVHNRAIERYCDDSIVRVIHGRELMVRRARGYAPLPIHIPATLERPILAVGGQLKNTIAIGTGDAVFISQHIGDLETAESLSAFKKTIEDFRLLYNCAPAVIVHDAHPEYLSTSIANNELSAQWKDASVTSLQHHYAHIASCMAENELTGPVTGFAWDGTGFGTDGTIWGGECICCEGGAFRRVGTIRSFKLPGGATAIREPRRCAVSIVHEIYGGDQPAMPRLVDDGFTERDHHILHDMLAKDINSPATTSMGRIFDAVSAFCGVRMENSFEGQAAMELEHLASTSGIEDVYPVVVEDVDGLLMWNWIPMFESIIDDVKRGRQKNEIATMFHTTLAAMILRMAVARNLPKVVLSGGCFQNTILLEHTVTLLRTNGFTPYWHQRVPTNDGGISLGQIYSVILAQHTT